MAEIPELETIEQERKTNSGGGGEQHPTKVLDPEALYRQGITAKTRRFEKQITDELGAYGVKPVTDSRGRVDIKQSLASLAKAGQPEAAAVLEQRYAGKIAELTHENELLKGEIQMTRITATVREKIAALNPANLDDAVYLFMRNYNIKLDEEDGSLMVCDQAGNPLHDRGTLAPLTVEMAALKFSEEKPGLFSKQSGNALQGLGSMKGSPSSSTRTNEGLNEQYMNALRAGDKETAKKLKVMMTTRVREGIAEQEAG